MQFGRNAMPAVILACALVYVAALRVANAQLKANSGPPVAPETTSAGSPTELLQQQMVRLPRRGRGAVHGTNEPEPPASSVPVPFAGWEGKIVRGITFKGVAEDRLKPLPGNLPQALGTPLTRNNVSASLRVLFATGLFDTVDAEVDPAEDGVALVFAGTARTFIGTVTVDGAKGATMNTQV